MAGTGTLVVKDGNGASQTISTLAPSGQSTSANSASTVLSTDHPPVPTLNFTPIRGATVALTVGPTATTAPVALGANVANSYRVRNAASSASPVTFVLVPNNSGSTTVPAIPVPYGVGGTGGTVGDKTVDPGGVEIIGLSAAQQTALAAGTLYLSAVTPAGGSATLSITPGVGS